MHFLMSDWAVKKEVRNPHPSELLVSEYFNHSTTDSKLSLLTGNMSQNGIWAIRWAEKKRFDSIFIIFFIFILIYDSHRDREAETQAEGEAGSMHREPDMGFDPGSPGSRPVPKAGAKPLRHPGIPDLHLLKTKESFSMYKVSCQDSLRE